MKLQAFVLAALAILFVCGEAFGNDKDDDKDKARLSDDVHTHDDAVMSRLKRADNDDAHKSKDDKLDDDGTLNARAYKRNANIRALYSDDDSSS